MAKFETNYKGLNCITFRDGSVKMLKDEEIDELLQTLDTIWRQGPRL